MLCPWHVHHWEGKPFGKNPQSIWFILVISIATCHTQVPAISSMHGQAKVLEEKIAGTYPGWEIDLIGHSMVMNHCQALPKIFTQDMV
jgi:hypothetical protein